MKATIWHEAFNGVTRFNVAFTRLCHDADRWWDGASFQRDDLPSLGRLAEDVHTWIGQQHPRPAPAGGKGDPEEPS